MAELALTPPTFLVIGAGKAGTTTLHHMLDTLSSVHMSPMKETRYFSLPENPSFPLSRYYELFEAGAGVRHRGESSPSYTMFPCIRGVPERIHAMDPTIRLVYIVREPVARMVSSYAHARRRGQEFRPIDEALTTQLVYAAPSMYALQLKEYLRFFELDQIHVETVDDLRQDPAGVLDRIAGFLEVPSDGHVVAARNATNRLAVRRPYAAALNMFRSKGLERRRWQRRLQASPIGSRRLDESELRIDDDLAVELRRMFSEDIAALEDLLSRSFHDWRAPTLLT